MQCLLAILLLVTTWLPAQAQTKSVPCETSALPYTTGEMQDYFTTYNRQYWDSKLSKKTRVIWTALTNRYGETHQEADGSFTIKLDVIKNKEPNMAKATLLHEMCHIKVWGEPCHTGRPQGSCTRWLIELHRIMLEGAFDDII